MKSRYFRSFRSLIGVALGLSIIYGTAPARAQFAPSWVPVQIAAAPDGTSRVLWVQNGGLTANNTYAGDIFQVWTLDSSDNVLAQGPAYGPIAGYVANRILVASDGSVRLELVNRSGNSTTGDFFQQVSFNSQGVETSQGPVYSVGPGWSVADDAANGTTGFGIAGDNTTRLIWVQFGTGTPPNYTGDAFSVWSFDTNGSVLQKGPTYGPAAGYGALDLAVLPNGNAFLDLDDFGSFNPDNNPTGDSLWVWLVDNTGTHLSNGQPTGALAGFSVGNLRPAADGTARVDIVGAGPLDAHGFDTGDSVTLANIDGSGDVLPNGPVYGPYSYTLVDNLLVAPDGTERLDWLQAGSTVTGEYSGDQYFQWVFGVNDVAVGTGQSYGPPPPPPWMYQGSAFGVNDVAVGTGQSYGPYPDTKFVNVDIDPADGSLRALWYTTEDALLAWSLDTAGALTAMQTSALFPADLEMCSQPYEYSNLTLDELFGYSGVTLASWTPVPGKYNLISDAAPAPIGLGQGYWVRFPQNVAVTAQGTPAPAENFTFDLQPGWNLIGDPFLLSVSTAALSFDNGTVSFAQATGGRAPIVYGTLYKYEAGSNSYAAAGSLDPEQGYWIYAFAQTDMTVPYPLPAGGG